MQTPTEQPVDSTPQNISTDELANVTGGKLPPGIDEAMAEGERQARHRSQRGIVY